MEYEEYYALERKYRDAPRKGWSVKGSWAKGNQTIEVNRQEIVKAISEAGQAAYSSKSLCIDAIFYEKMLCALADGEDDAVECDKCHGIYQEGWLDGNVLTARLITTLS